MLKQDLVVDLAYQRQGLGTRPMQTVLEKNRQVYQVGLSTDGHPAYHRILPLSGSQRAIPVRLLRVCAVPHGVRGAPLVRGIRTVNLWIIILYDINLQICIEKYLSESP